MSKYYTLFLFSFCLLYSNAKAQVLPSQIEMLVTIDQKKLRKKQLVTKAKQYDFLDLLLLTYKNELKEKYYLVETLRDDPHAMGLDTSQNIYLFGDKVDDYMQMGVHFFISNISLFEDAVDSLTLRERSKIGISDNAPPALREALMKEQAKQDAYWAQFRPKPVPNTNFKMLKLRKATYVWTSDRAYIFQTHGLNEWERVDEDNEAEAAKYFQEYKKMRAKSKERYIENLTKLSVLSKFNKGLSEEDDILIWLLGGDSFILPNNQVSNSPQAKPMDMLLANILAASDKEQIVTINFEADKILLKQTYSSLESSSRMQIESLPISFLKENALLSVKEQYIENVTTYLNDKEMDKEVFYPLGKSETLLLHGFQKYLIDYIRTTHKGVDTIKAEIVRPVFTSFLAFDDAEKQADFVAYLLKEGILETTDQPKFYHSTDTAYTAQVFSHPKGLFWSMKAEISTPDFQNEMLDLIAECPSAYKYNDMRAGIEALSLEMPSLFTPFYRTVKNNWKSSQRTEAVRNGEYTREWKFDGFQKDDPNATSIDMLLEMVNAFYSQVEFEAKER